MLNALSVWFLVTGVFGAGLFNTIGTRATQSSFVGWGRPDAWVQRSLRQRS